MKKVWKKLGSSIILMKRSPHMKIGFLAMFCRKFPKKLGFSIPLMKSSPPNTWKMDFWRNFVQILEKKSNFRLSWCKGAPHTWKLVSATFCENFRKKSGAFIILNHLFPPDIAKIHLFGILTQNIKKILDDLGYPTESKSEKQKNFKNFVLKTSCLWFSGS